MTSSGTAVRPSLKGVNRFENTIQYRGIQYATIKERFAKPKLNTDWQNTTDYTKFGPRCPQSRHNIHQENQIPKHVSPWDPEEEDELRCANLTVTCPADTSLNNLPVLIWIYGGGQMVSYGSAGQMLGDPAPLVAQSVELGKPIVLVSIHYRLNIFGFGGREGELNLDLQDQGAAIDWVRRYISLFGGNPEEITLAGQSAGAIYTHAQVVSGASVARVILASGSMFAKPPESDKRGLGLLGLVEGDLQLMQIEKGNMNPAESPESTIEGASAALLVKALEDIQVTSKWMWQQPALEGWEQIEKVFGKLKGVMVGDCEYEGAIYRSTIKTLNGPAVLKAFQLASTGLGQKVADAYGVDPSNDDASRLVAYQFLGDDKFNYPAFDIAEKIHHAGRKVYRYTFDQVNPFAESAERRVAHHGVDLFATFGGYDEHVGREMQAVGRDLRTTWISFINGEEPWNSDRVYAYGPDGKTGELTQDEALLRRRTKQFKVLREVGLETTREIRDALLLAGAAARGDDE